MSITIKQIAKLAGVSRGTVDRVLNNRGQVSIEVKEKVLKIAADFNYKKNVLASRLAINTELKISIVLPDATKDAFWDAPFQGISKAEKSIADYGITLDIQLFDLFDSESYSAAFEKATYNRPDAILVAPVYLKETTSFIQISKQNNIPIVCINSEIDSNDLLSFLGQDSFQSGILAGKLFDLRKTKESQIIVITQGHNSNNAIHIKKKIEGLKHYNIQNDCGFEIIDLHIEDFLNEETINEKSKYIKENFKNLKGIFFSNSRAYNFLNKTKILDKMIEDITIIGYDLIDQNIQLLKENKIDFILHQKPEMQGYLGLMSLFDYFILNKNIERKQYLPIDIVLKENLLSYLDERDRFYRAMY